MSYKIKFIKNPVRAEDLISLYNSELYQEFITELEKKFKFADSDGDIQMIRQVLQREYLILNITIEEVIGEMNKFKKEFLSFCISRAEFYRNYNDENPDGEFAEGEELDDNEKSIIVEDLGIARISMLSNFCEFYLLKFGNKERTLHYLKTTKMPYAKKHLSEITNIYKKLSLT